MDASVKSQSKVSGDYLQRQKCKQQITDPPTLPDIQRESQIKILGVTITKHLSVSEQVRDVIDKCSQTMYVLKVLRSHGLNNEVLKDIYRLVIMATLLYASSAWWRFATASDKHRIEAFVRRGVRLQ